MICCRCPTTSTMHIALNYYTLISCFSLVWRFDLHCIFPFILFAMLFILVKYVSDRALEKYDNKSYSRLSIVVMNCVLV